MEKEHITLREALPADAAEISDIMQKVYGQLENKTLFVCDDAQVVEELIATAGGVVACGADGRIAGSFLLRFPGEAEDNLGRDIGLPEEALCRVAHMESAVVLPRYRGRGLQKRMLDELEKRIDTDVYTYFLATVSPDNPASCKTFERAGYRHVMTKEKYGGLQRRIYLKEPR